MLTQLESESRMNANSYFLAMMMLTLLSKLFLNEISERTIPQAMPFSTHRNMNISYIII